MTWDPFPQPEEPQVLASRETEALASPRRFLSYMMDRRFETALG